MASIKAWTLWVSVVSEDHTTLVTAISAPLGHRRHRRRRRPRRRRRHRRHRHPTPPPAAPVGAKTIPLAKAPDPLGPTKPVPTAGAPATPGAPGSATPVGAKTIPLAKAPVSGGPGPVGKATVPLQQPGGAKPLPQATVKMGQTQPMAQNAPTSQISQKPNIQSTAAEVEDEWDEEYEESGLMPFAIIVLILALVVLGIELMTKMGVGG